MWTAHSGKDRRNADQLADTADNLRYNKYKYKNNAADHNDICENHGEKEMPAAETVFQRLPKEEVINVFHHRVNKIGN